MTVSRFSSHNSNPMTTFDISTIQTEENLAFVLELCGLPSEHLVIKHKLDEFLPVFHEPIARHLTDEAFKNLYVAVNSNKLLIYVWIMKVCELSGEFDEDFLRERLALCANPDKAPGDSSQCICLKLPLPFDHYREVKNVGEDKTNGRFGTVTIRECLHCKRLWLHYFVEYEVYSRSGRYYMGLIIPDMVEKITAETAVDYLNNLDWTLYGGSFFDNKTGRSDQKGVYVD